MDRSRPPVCVNNADAAVALAPADHAVLPARPVGPAEADALAGEIAAWLDRPVSTGSIDEDGRQPLGRTVTCLKEIWVECLKRDATRYDRGATLSVGAAMRLVEGWEPVGQK